VLCRTTALATLATAVTLVSASPGAAATGDEAVAALQVALHARGLYQGPIDGVLGPQTAVGVRRLQKRARLPVDGVVGPRTRAALGRFGRHPLGSRIPKPRAVGWDVASLQFLIAWHGFPSGVFDGVLGDRTAIAIRRFQRWAGLPPDGRAGPATLAALRLPPAVSPISLGWPVQADVGDLFGPRGRRFHSGIDFPAPPRTPVAAAGPGCVVWAGWRRGGWGKLVTIVHSRGVRSMYAHLSRVDVRLGECLAAGFRVGLVGSTGHSTGPHLHFELRLRGAAIDPLTAIRPGSWPPTLLPG
jgi:peptidoglycan hydrolase-like protein with peptidoglycan-binding domain